MGSGGNAIGTKSPAKADFDLSGGTATGATLNSGGFEGLGSFFTTGGTAISTTINSGGSEEIDTGGSAIGTTVNSGGLQTVGNFEESTGTAFNTVINTGGKQDVTASGIAISTTVSAGGLQLVGDGFSVLRERDNDPERWHRDHREHGQRHLHDRWLRRNSWTCCLAARSSAP